MASSHDGPPVPATGIIALILVVASAFLAQYVPLHGSRPATVEQVPARPAEQQDVDARLWEDPFAAVERHREKAAQRAKADRDVCGSTPECVAAWNADVNRHDRTVVADAVARSTDVLLLPVMVFGGRYGEDAEHRRRTRYAVVSALGVAGYTPVDSEQIGYYVPRRSIARAPEIVPYEWFEHGHDPRRILVLWLDETAFGDAPLAAITTTIAQIDPYRTCLDEAPEHTGRPIKIIGPASSTTLRTIAAELERDRSIGATCGTVELYSGSATAVDRAILPPSRAGTSTTQRFFAEAGVPFYRVSGTDADLVDALLHELELRGVDVVSGMHVALISEWDTIYGRQLPASFADAVSRLRGTRAFPCPAIGDAVADYGALSVPDINDPRPRVSTACAPRNVHQFSYLRGLDGVVPGTAPEPPHGPDKNGRADRTTVPAERAEQGGQLDYLRRLAAQIREQDDVLWREDREHIEAIGILGSDLYDKLLVLQAVRREFPKARVFTTDLDARLLHAEEYRWTRNLVIASNYGLKVTPSLQGHVPPFRDSYQTATFLATRVALENARPARRAVAPPRVTTDVIPPRIFEIGRTAAIDLSASGGGRCADLASCETVHPPPDPFLTLPAKRTVSSFVVGLACGIYLAWASSYRVRRVLREAAGRMRHVVRTWPVTCVTTLVAATALAVMIAVEGRLGEPFALLEGVSIWPTEIIRLLATALAAAFILRVRSVVARCIATMTGEYFRDARPRALSNWSARNPLVNVPTTMLPAGPDEPPKLALDVATFWQAYVRAMTPGNQFRRIVPPAAGFVVLAGCVISVFGMPGLPYRGDVSWWVDRMILAASVVGLVGLIFIVTDAVRLCHIFTEALSRPTRTSWPDTIEKQVARDLGVDREYVAGWIDLRFVAEWSGAIRSFISYPMIVTVLLVAARVSVFDN